MFKYGKDNVRGGKYVAVEQTVIDELLGEDLCNKIDQRFRTITVKQLRNKEKDNKIKTNINIFFIFSPPHIIRQFKSYFWCINK